MKKFQIQTLLAIGASTAGLAFADQPPTAAHLEVSTLAATHKALRYAPFTYGPNREIVLTGDWVQVDQSTRGGNCSDGMAFDAFDISTDGLFTIDPLGNQCGLPATSKYSYFGSGFYWPYFVDDLTVEAAAAGGISSEMTFAANKGISEQTWIAIATYEDVGDPNNCGVDTDGDLIADAPVGGFLGGFVFDFGITGGPGGYQQYLIDLCGDPNGDAFQLPADGNGGIDFVYANDFVDTNADGIPDTLILADQISPMLWFNWNNFAPNIWTLAGSQTVILWPDGAFTGPPTTPNGEIDIATECYGIGPFATLTCPGNDEFGTGGQFGTTFAMFYTAGGDPCACPGDFDGSNDVGLGDLSALLSSFGGTPSNPCMDTDGDGLVGLADLSAFLSQFGSTCP